MFNKISLIIITFLTLPFLTSQTLAHDDAINTRDDESHIGVITVDGKGVLYIITLDEGEGVIITAVATPNSNLDPYLILADPQGDIVAENDDYEYPTSVNSRIEYIAEESGEYTIHVTNYPDFIGEFELTIDFVTADDIESSVTSGDISSGSNNSSEGFGQDSDINAESVQGEYIDGSVQTMDTENFRIHYALDGRDATTLRFVNSVALAVEEVYDIQINQIGWAQPPRIDDLIGVYIRDIEEYLGYIGGSSTLGDNPSTEAVEAFAGARYIVIDNDYSEYQAPIRLMRTTVAHEFHHVIQSGYDDLEYSTFSWAYEATASWMETVTYPQQEEATVYVPYAFENPQICFGGQQNFDPTGFGIYGAWLFLEYMQANLGSDAPIQWWENIAIYDGWESLDATLVEYAYSVEDFVAGYHINNLVRDYMFVSRFASSAVAMEEFINATGEWTPSGEGVQELAVNYFEFRPTPSVYEIALDTTNPDLELYAIGIVGDRGDVFSVGGDSVIINSNLYNYVYLMVFNTDYDDRLNNCNYEDYSLTVSASDALLSEPDMTVDASQFRRLR